jgi:hypothetical protein
MASGSTNTTATTVAISGLTAIALQDNGAALTAGQHAAGKMFMGVLNTTSTVQLMQVQVSGTDPLIVSSLTVTGDATIGDDLTLLSDASILGFGENTDVTLTHVHDTGLLLNSTRQLQFNDASQYINAPTATVLDINATDEIELNATAVDINATLDVSGNSVLASVDVTAVATAATFEPDGDTSAGDNAALGYTAALGAILTGQGSTNDVTLVNDADATVLGIPTGTTNVDIVGTATAATFEPDGDTAAADNAAIGYTAAEGLILTGQGSTDDITIKNDADTTVLNVTTGGTNVEISAGNLLFGTASKGVYLGVDGATASNLLDDYEEGNWTCTIAASGGSFTSGAQSVTGTYTKTGRDVHVQAYVANKDTSGTSGNLSFTGLPLSAAATSIGSIGFYNMGLANAGGAWALISPSGTTIVPYMSRDNTTWVQTTIAAGTTKYALIDVTYQHDP